MCLIVVKDETQFAQKYSDWHRVFSLAGRGFKALMEVLKVMFGNNCSFTKRYLKITSLSDSEDSGTAEYELDHFRVCTDFNLLLLMCVFFYSSAAFVLPLTPRFLPLLSFPSIPASHHQLPEELSFWIAALSVHPVRLRDGVVISRGH